MALAGFPYVDYHPGFPYSVFLGPGGAQYNTPQMYWIDIGTSVDAVYAHTYAYNRLYERAIDPARPGLQPPAPRPDHTRFRQLSRAYGAPGVSWWDWQEASDRRLAGDLAVGRRQLTGFTRGPDVRDARLHGARTATSSCGRRSTSSAPASRSRSTAHSDRRRRPRSRASRPRDGLPSTGLIDQATWPALLRYAPASVHWVTPRQAHGRDDRGRRPRRAGPEVGVAAGQARRDRRRRRRRAAALAASRAGCARARRRRGRRASSAGSSAGCARDATRPCGRSGTALDAISLLVWPSAISRSTSISRADRSSGGPTGVGGSAASRAPSSGLRYVRPSAASRTACTSSASAASLST